MDFGMLIALVIFRDILWKFIILIQKVMLFKQIQNLLDSRMRLMQKSHLIQML
jgi:hypothetical protein